MPLHRGKIAREPTVIEARALTRDDLALIPAARVEGGVNRVQKLRDTHHRLARFLAAGLRVGEAAERSGYSYNSACTLRKDPAFLELVERYRDKITESFVESADTYHELLFSNMVKAERMLADKIEAAEDEGEFLPTRDLIAISRDAADRTGYGKRQTNLNVNVDFAAKLEATIARSRQIEGRRVSAPSLAPQSPVPNHSPAVAKEPATPSAPALRRI